MTRPAGPRPAPGAAAAVLLAAVLFGTTGTAQALGPPGLNPLGVGAGRIAVGGLLLVLFAVARGGLGPAARRAPGAAVVAALGVAGYQLCFFAAVDRAGVALGTVVTIGSAPAWTGLVGWLAGQGRPGGRWTVATALAAVGVAMIGLGGGAVAGADGPGVGLALLAGLSYAAYTVGGKRLIDAGAGPVAALAVAFGVAAVLMVPLLALLGPALKVDPGGVLLVVGYLAVVPTAVAYVLFAIGLRHLPAATVATLTLAEPVVATALGVGLLAEPLSAAQIAGGVLVGAGLVLLADGGRAAPAPRVRVARSDRDGG